MKKIILIIILIVFVFYLGFKVKWSKLFSHGVLSEAHEELEKSGECKACHTKGQKLDIDNPSIMKMIFMALYNLDKFREFVFNSTFLDRFEVEPKRIKRIKEDELALLKFAFDWIKFGLFGEKLFWVKENPAK